MIKRMVFIVFGCLVLCNSALACDSAGCSASNMGIGLLTNYQHNFIRLSYFDTRFKTSPEHGDFVSDKFMKVDLSIRFALGKSKRIRLMANLPFGINTRFGENEKLRSHGLADVKLLANYVILNKKEVGKQSKLHLEAGGGLSLPTGKYDPSIHDKNLPENFNIGKGAVGYIFQMSTIFSFKKNGLVFSNNYQLEFMPKA